MIGYIGMNDTGNSLAAAYTAKYLAGTNPNNFTSMIPGLTDVRQSSLANYGTTSYFL